jgi:hypothetical protein
MRRKDGASEGLKAWRDGFDGAKILEVQVRSKKTSATPISVLHLVYEGNKTRGETKAGRLRKDQPSQILEYCLAPDPRA